MEKWKTVFPVFQNGGLEKWKTKEPTDFAAVPANYTAAGKPVFLGVQENGFPEVFQGLFRAVIPRIVVAREEGLQSKSLKVRLYALRRAPAAITLPFDDIRLKPTGCRIHCRSAFGYDAKGVY